MGKNKLHRFNENNTFPNLIQPDISEVFKDDYLLKGGWSKNYFQNTNPIVIELGCGKGEYTVGLANKFSEKNFIGIDIKGARLWRGAKTAFENRMKNVAFIRTRIEFIASFFGGNEVDEIWLTFPDPQPKWIRAKKRLTSSRFLNMYKTFLKPDGLVHLKTDSQELHRYTLQLIQKNNLRIIHQTQDLYNSNLSDDILSIKTFYESQYLEQGLNITYLCFNLNHEGEIEEPFS